MKTLFLSRILAVALALGLVACKKPEPTKEEIFAAVHENVHAFEKKDLDTVMATIHPQSPVFAGTREATQEMFKTVDVKYTLSDLKLISVTENEVKVSFVQRSEKVGGSGMFVNNIVEGIHTLRRDGKQWKIYKTLNTKITDLQGKALYMQSDAPPASPATGATPAPSAPPPAARPMTPLPSPPGL